MSNPAEGWFADPAGVPGHRYWNGVQWTVWVLRDGSLSNDGRGAAVPQPAVPAAAMAGASSASAVSTASADSTPAVSTVAASSVSVASVSVSSVLVEASADDSISDGLAQTANPSSDPDYSLEAIESMLDHAFVDDHAVALREDRPVHQSVSFEPASAIAPSYINDEARALAALAIPADASREVKRGKGKFLVIGLVTLGVAAGSVVSIPYVKEMTAGKNKKVSPTTKLANSTSVEKSSAPGSVAKSAVNGGAEASAPKAPASSLKSPATVSPQSTILSPNPNPASAAPLSAAAAAELPVRPAVDAQSPSSSTPASSSAASVAPPRSAEAPSISIPAGLPPEGLVTEDLVVGNGAIAAVGMQLTVQYVGVEWSTGQTFDSTYTKGEPFTFTLGANEVISGWEIGLADMRVGSRRKLIVPSNMAYGDLGTEGIASGETLVFIVDLVSAVYKA